jgi:hypothetical protein
MSIFHCRRGFQAAMRLMQRPLRRVGLVIVAFVLAVSPVSAQSDWAPFRDIGGIFTAGAPITAVSRNPNQIDLFVTGINGHVYTSWYIVGSDWTGIGHRWRDIGGVFPAGAPIAAVVRNPNQIDLFITGHNGHVYTSWYIDGSDWSGLGDKWRDIGGVFPAGAPLAAVSRRPNQIDLFVTGLNGHVYTSWYIDGSDWSGLGDKWLDIGGVFPVGAPLSAIARHPHQLDVFVTGLNGHVYTSFYLDGGQWSGFGDKWMDIGGVFQSAAPVTAITRNPAQIDLFITGLNGNVYTSWYIDGNAWSGLGDRWLDIGGVFPNAAKVSAVTRNPNRMDLFISGLNGDVYTSWFNDGGQWSGLGNRWRSVGGSFPVGAPLAALSRQPDLLDVFVTGNNGIVYTSWSIDGGAPIETQPTKYRVKQPVKMYQTENDENELGDVPEGTMVAVLGCNANNRCQIDGEGYKGWIYDGDDYDTLDYQH